MVTCTKCGKRMNAPHLPAVRDPSHARLSDPEGPCQLLQCLTGTELQVSGLTVGRLADGQANQNMRSVPKTRASKDAVSSLGMPVLLQRYTVHWPSPRPVETGTDRTGQSLLW